MSDEFHVRITPEQAERWRGRLGIDWEVIDRQLIPTTPNVLSSLAIGLGTPFALIGSVIMVAAPTGSRPWTLGLIQAVLAGVAAVTAGLAAFGGLRSGAVRRRVLDLASTVLSRFASPQQFRKRLDGLIEDSRHGADPAGARPVVYAALVFATTVTIGVVARLLHPAALVGAVPAALLAGAWFHEMRQAAIYSGARGSVHAKGAYITGRTLREVLLFAVLQPIVLQMLVGFFGLVGVGD